MVPESSVTLPVVPDWRVSATPAAVLTTPEPVNCRAVPPAADWFIVTTAAVEAVSLLDTLKRLAVLLKEALLAWVIATNAVERAAERSLLIANDPPLLPAYVMFLASATVKNAVPLSCTSKVLPVPWILTINLLSVVVSASVKPMSLASVVDIVLPAL